ncbi:MAG: hypothetical protein Q9N34_06730 [Aquificota bacterium]|nr:hypothetical protein [Aquificota bacterium]
MNATVSMKDGNVVYAQGTDVNTGATVTYTRSDEGIEMLNYQLGGAGVKMMKDKDGEWRVVSADSPVSMKFATQYAESLSNTKAQMDRVSYLFRKGEGISNTDTETFSAGYKLAYEIAHGKGGATETERSFARDLVKSVEEAALTKLGEEGKVQLEGKKIDEFEARKRMKPGIEIADDVINKVLPERFKSKFGLGVEKAIATKDGYVVQDSKGQYWFFAKNEQVNEALQDAWKTTVSGRNRDFFEERERTTGQDYTDHSFKSELQSFRNRMAEYAAQRSEELGRKLDYVNRNAREFGASITHLFLGDMIKDAEGSNIQEKLGNALVRFNELLSTPEGIQKLQEMGDEVLDRMLEDRTLEKPDVNEEAVRNAGILQK